MLIVTRSLTRLSFAVSVALSVVATAACNSGSDEPALGSRAQEDAATGLFFSPQPVNVARNAPFTVRVEARDGLGAVDTTYTGDVTIDIGTAPGTGSLTGVLTVPAVAGVATFPGIRVTEAGLGYTLVAQSVGLIDATSGSFDVLPFGAADHLEFTVDPTNTTAGELIASVEVTVRDTGENIVEDYATPIVLALGNNPGGAGTLLGDLSNPPAMGVGVATFGDLEIRRAASGYTITASSGSIVGATSQAFDIVPAAPSQIVTVASPGETAATATLTPAPQFQIRDAFDNLTGFNGAVDIALDANPGSSTLSGTTTVNAVGGVVSFPGLSLNKVGNGYTLTASSGLLATGTTAAFNIVPNTATHLVFTTQPGNTTAGATFAPAIVVEARDAGQNLATGFGGDVTLAIDTNPGSGTLSGTNPVTASGGIAIFGNVEIDRSGTGYTLTASASGVSSDTSNAFDILPGNATQLVITAEPTNEVAGDPNSPAVVVEARDALGNLATGFNGEVTATKNSGPALGALSGTTAVNASSGVATFSNLRLDRTGSYTLAFNAGGVTGDISASFTITPAAAATLAFTVEPSETVQGQAISPPVQVTAFDAFGNVATGFSGAVTIAKNSGPGAGVLGGDLSNNASLGVATFNDLTLDVVGAYTLLASAAGVASDTSASFDVTLGAADHLVFAVEPPNTTTAGVAMDPDVVVHALNASNAIDTSFNGTVTLTIGAGNGSAVVSGGSVAAVNGVATFDNLRINLAGTGYTLVAASGSLDTDETGPFDIVHGPVASLVFTTQPPATRTSGETFGLVVTARDSQGNTVSDYTEDVTLSKASGPGPGTLGGSLTVAASGGVATFSGLSFDIAGGYTIQASDGTRTATSSTVTVSHGAVSALVFSAQPPGTRTSGQAFGLEVTARDAAGNTVLDYTENITLSKASGPPSGTLGGTLTVAAVGGVAAFSGLTLDIAGTYTIQATDTTRTITTGNVVVSHGAVASLAITSQPPATRTSGQTFGMDVTARDGAGNTVLDYTSTINLTLASGPGTLAGTTSLAASGGVASFSGLSLNLVGTYTIQASDGTRSVTSTDIVVSHGAVASLVITSAPPASVVAGAGFGLVVTARDGAGNTVLDYTSNVTITKNTGPASGVLGGTASVAASSGVATFSGLTLNIVGTYTLQASDGTRSVLSGNVAVTPATAASLHFTVQPTSQTAGEVLTPAPTVEVRDSFGNVVTDHVGNITMTKEDGPANGTLSGTTVVAVSNGVAVFSNLELDKNGSYTLLATAGSLTVESASFNITPAAASSLVFTIQPPASRTAGQGFSVTVEARDPHDNLAISFVGPVTLNLQANPGGGTLSGVNPVTAVAGVAVFTGLSIDKSGNGYVLRADASGLTPGDSNAFNIVADAATHFAFSGQPTDEVAGVAISPAVVVEARDQFENIATTFSGNITIAIAANPGGSTLGGTAVVAASGGQATFSNLTLDKVGTGYTLSASGSVTTATSATFAITPAAASKLAFFVQPSTTVAGVAINPAVVVRALDQFDNHDTNFALGITVAIGNNPGTSTLGGTLTQTASGGSATFNNLTLDKVGTGYTLTASRSGLTGATSTAFNVTPAAATHIAYAVQPSTVTAGVSIAPAVMVQALDPFENVDTNFAGNVVVALTTNPGSSTLSGTLTQGAIAGVATFGNLSLNKAASGYRLTATAAGLASPTVESNPFTVIPAAASELVYVQNPTNVVAGFSNSPSIVVQARDAFDNVATSYTLPITLAIGANPGGSTLSGVFSLNAVAGTATFPAVILDKVGNGYTLVASGTNVTSETSLPFNVTPGAASKLVFTVQPTDQLAGTVLTPPIEVVARDQFDNLATGYSGQVTISINNNPGGSNLLGTTQRNASGGVVTFNDLSLNRVGDGYTLSVTASSLTPAISAPFNIVSGMANRLFFSVQPSSTTSGAAISPAVQISVRDSLGNLATGFNGNITIAIFANPNGATLGGTTTVAAAGGVASFSTLTLDRVGSGYTLIATGSGLSSAISTTFNITPASAATLHFTVQPGDVVAGVAHAPSIQVSARDAAGNLSTSFTGDVTLAIANNPGGATLGGTLTRTAAAGIATFSGITLDKVGLDYTLSASAMGLPSAASTVFDVSPASATKLGFTTQPASTAAGDPITPPVRVTAFDQFDNVSTQYTGNVTVAIDANPGGSVLSGTTTVGSTLGVASFSTLSLDRAATGYTLTASAAGLTGTTSLTFEITPSNASRLVFTVQPTTSVAGVDIAPALRVEARDTSGNLDLTFNGMVSMSLGNNPGSATLMGTPMVMASGGVAIFDDVSLDKVGTGYTLVAAGSGLVSATSSAFNITPAAASQLVFAQQPLDAVAGSFLAPPVRVEARDAFDNVDTAFTAEIAIAIGANPGTSTLSGDASVAAVAGVATFADLSLDHVGTGYTLMATSSAMAVTSATFAITPAAATRLGFFVQPGNTPAGQFISPAVVVEALDPFGNRATSYSGAITVALGANPGASTLSGTLSGPAINGARAFNDLLLDRTAMGYTLTATATGLGSATSALFDVTPGAATTLVFTVQPSDAVAGAAIAPAIRVEVHDGSGNVVPTFNGNLTLSIGANPGGSTLGGTATRAATAGVALFDDITLNRQGSNYTLNATGSGVSSAVSLPFSITPAAASRLAVSQQPTETVAGLPITPGVQIAVEDAFGNRVPSFTGNISIALEANPGSATLGGTTTVAASNGVASFTTLTVNRAAVGYTLRATSTGLTMVDTVSFDVISGVAAALVFGVQPGDVVAGVAFAPAVTVTVRDGQGNIDPTFSGNITLAISNNPGSATLAGTISVLVTAGTATFDNVSLDKVGVDYTLAASAAGVPSATSAAFDVSPAAAATYVQSGLAANVPAAAVQSVVFTAHDAFGNVATGYDGTANLTSSDPELEAPATVVFTDGVSPATSLELHTGGPQTVTVTDQTTASVTATFDTNVTAIDMPTVRITDPMDGEEVGGNQVPIRAEGTVAANATVAMVEILVDGTVIDTGDALPFSTTWDATGMAIGTPHAITARVTDSEGNVVTSDEVVVTIMANEDGCCSAGGDPSGSFALAGFVLVGVLLRRRRRSAARA